MRQIEYLVENQLKPSDSEEPIYEERKLLKRAGVRETRLHDARHTAATVLMAHEVPERTVMGVMGWSSTSMAARYHPLVAATDQLRLRPQNRRLDRLRSWRRFLVLTRGGGCGIRTREGVNPTRFPNPQMEVQADPQVSVCAREAIIRTPTDGHK